MNPILLQKQLRDNSADLQDYYKDIQSWGEEMKRKEAALTSTDCENTDVPLPRNKQPKKEIKKKEAPPSNPATKAPKDFSYWEKFDVEAECEKVDQSKSDNDSELTDEYDETDMEAAQQEKEKGNIFFKVGEWKAAIKCYTNAIELFDYDATFYANRALCHIKMEQYKSAEADCTIAIQLDGKYVKALHRRAVARDALKQYKEAKDDLDQVLVIEPENKESQKLLDKIEKLLNPAKTTTPAKVEPIYQRPVSKFTASRQNKPVPSTSKAYMEEDEGPAFRELIVERKKPQVKNESAVKTAKEVKQKSIVTPVNQGSGVLWPAGCDSDVEIVKSISKQPKDRSAAPLKRIVVEQTTLRFSKE